MSRVLWVRSEVFDHCVFNTSVRWTVPKVLEFLSSLRAVTSVMSISQAKWIEATTTQCKPTLTETEAAAYWHVFAVIQQAVLGTMSDGFDIRIMGILLLCQVFSPHRVTRTDAFTKTGEMWPGHERGGGPVSSPRHSPRGSSPRVAASAQTPLTRGRDTAGALLGFFRQHLGYYLQIACFALSAEPATVSVEDFDLLGLVLCGGPSFRNPAKRVSEAVPEIFGKRSMPLKDLRKAIEKGLIWNSEAYPPGDQSHPGVSPGASLGSVNVTNLTKTTWFQRASATPVEFLNISGCNDCAIYVTSRVRYCLIAGCHECTIIMSAVSTLCSIQNCEKISVHVAAHCFKMENSIDSSAFLYCHLPPVLTGDTRGIKLAPYNVLYSQNHSILQSAGMRLDPEYVDVWAHPVCCTLASPDETIGGRSGCLDEPHHSTYHFVHPSTFQPVVVPEARPQAPSAATQLCLPQTYDDALWAKNEEMRSFHQLLADIGDEAKKRRAQQAIQGHFRDWLQSTGKSRQLADLARLEQQQRQPPQ